MSDMIWRVTIRYRREERVWEVKGVHTRYQAVIPCINEVIKEFELPGRAYQYWTSNAAKFGFEDVLEIQVHLIEDGRRLKGVPSPQLSPIEVDELLGAQEMSSD